jgi:hypothetical protein
VNHDENRVIGCVKDVWPEPPVCGINELLEVDIDKNPRLADKIRRGQVTGTSLEVLVGASLCPICFHIATDEKQPMEKGGWCDHLRLHKGRYDPKTGVRVFEINKNLQGSGHAIIESGEPADQGARIHEVFAMREPESETAPIFNQGMATRPVSSPRKSGSLKLQSEPGRMSEKKGVQPGVSPAVQAYIDRQAAKGKSARGPLGQRSSEAGLPSTQTPIPDLKGMAEQIKIFGNFRSSRDPEDVAMAGLPPKMRAMMAALGKMTAADKVRLGIESAEALRVDPEFVAACLKPIVATKKVAASDLGTTLSILMGKPEDRSNFIADLTDRSSDSAIRTGALKRLASRRSATQDHENIREIVLDTMADALRDAADQVGQAVTDETITDAVDGADKLVEGDEATKDFVVFLDEDSPVGEEAAGEKPGEIAEEEESTQAEVPEEKSEGEGVSDEPTEKKAVMTKEVPLDDVESTKDKTMKTAQAIPSVDSQKEIKPASTSNVEPDKLGGHKTENPDAIKVEQPEVRKTPTGTVPEASNLVLAALQRRQAELQDSMLSADDASLPGIRNELRKVAAQMKIQTGDFPYEGKDLGGNGMSVNPSPVDVPSAPAARATPTAKVPGSEEAAKVLPPNEGESLRKAASEQNIKLEVEPLPAAKATKPEEFPESEEQKAEKAKQSSMGKEIHPGNKDNALEKDKATKETKVTEEKDKAQKGQGEKTPATDANEKKDVEQKGQTGATTPVSETAEIKDKGQDKVTTNSADAELDKLQGKTEKTPAKSDDSADAAAKGQGTSPTKSEDIYPDAMSLKQAKLDVQFVENTAPKMRTASYWEVSRDSKPWFRISARAAFKDQALSAWDEFVSPEYGKLLVATVKRMGTKRFAAANFDEGDLEFVGVRKAQVAGTAGGDVMPASPANAQGPINAPPAVADGVLDATKPGLSLGDILPSLLAPLVAESETMSTSGAMQELVELAGNQEKVTELTTKLNESVQKLRTDSGKPAEPGVGAPPDANATPGAPAGAPPAPPAPNAQSTAPGPVNQGAIPMTAQASKREASMEKEIVALKAERSLLLRGTRIQEVVRQAQLVGIIPNYDTFYAQGGQSRRNAKKLVKAAFDKKVAEIAKMNDDSCLQVLETLSSATKKVAQSGKGSPGRRAAALQSMMIEQGGGRLMTGVPGETTMSDLDGVRLGSKGVRLSWKPKIANDINPEAVDAAMKESPIRRRD